MELEDDESTVRSYEIEDLGWVYCQGGGYFGGFDDGLGQGVYRGDFHQEGVEGPWSEGERAIGASCARG